MKYIKVVAAVVVAVAGLTLCATPAEAFGKEDQKQLDRIEGKVDLLVEKVHEEHTARKVLEFKVYSISTFISLVTMGTWSVVLKTRFLEKG